MSNDDIVAVIQANKYSSDPLAIYRAIIAARDEELRKQKPCAWLDGFGNYYTDDGAKNCYPVYAAPIPPTVTPSQEEALKAVDDMDDYARMAGIDAVGTRTLLKNFILARPEVTK